MSRNVIYNSNLSGSDSTVLIDDTCTTRKNGYSYSRLTDLIPHGNKKSNFRILSLIGAVILIFLSGYFACYLMSPVPNSHSILPTENETLHHTKIIINNNGNHMNATTEGYTKSIASAIDSKIKYTSEINDEIITERTVTTTTTTSRVSRTATPVNRIVINNTDGSVTSVKFNTSLELTKVLAPVNFTVLKEPQIDLNICLKNLMIRFEDIPGNNNTCVDTPVKRKSLILFKLAGSSFSTCLTTKEEKCHQYSKEKDLYNFIIGDHYKLYEGRPLSCGAHENYNIPDSSDSEIIIGTPYCVDFFCRDDVEKTRFYFVLKNLLDCLETEGILTDSYKMYFPSYFKRHLDNNFLRSYERRIRFDNAI